MRKVLLFGPIGDFGGRDIEVNLISASLSNAFEVKIFSTIYISKKSTALQNLSSVKFSSMQIKVYNSRWWLRFFARVFYFKNKKDKAPYAYVYNKLSKRLFDFKIMNIQNLREEIQKSDLVIACVQLTSVYLPQVIDCCNEFHIPFFVRTTGTIFPFERNYFDFLKRVPLFVHHSMTNADNLNKQIPSNYTIIDQCASIEETLLSIPIISGTSLIFGYLGRFSDEKGILPFIDFFQKNISNQLIIAGDGPQKEQLLLKIKKQKNIKWIGQLATEDISEFFRKIDVLVIPSLEESGPLVGLEAMASGKLIFSTRVGAMQERLEGTLNNFWFDIEDTNSLETIVKKLENLNALERTNIATQNRVKYLQYYQRSIIEKKYYDLVLSILNEANNIDK
jgi:glycosyltransferase involved in cell wall biosynthesis